MEMIENPLKAKLARNQPIFGIWSIIPSPILAEVIGVSGFDFQILDMEHGPYDLGSLDASIRACESTGCSPLVRIPGIAQFVIQSAMDLGAHGIIVPQVADEAAAAAAVRCAKYAPDGTRGYNPFTRAASYKNPPNNQSGKLHNNFGFTSIIIESLSAYSALDKILQIRDLDMIYLGIYDMAVAMGCQGDVSNPRVEEFVTEAVPRIRRAGKAVGMMVMSTREIEKALKLGANVLVYAVDTFIIHRALQEASDAFQSLSQSLNTRNHDEDASR
jgi:4-hydroxy-2-oxoheptanedioate aldolase